jgi:hypothetical protein
MCRVSPCVNRNVNLRAMSRHSRRVTLLLGLCASPVRMLRVIRVLSRLLPVLFRHLRVVPSVHRVVLFRRRRVVRSAHRVVLSRHLRAVRVRPVRARVVLATEARERALRVPLEPSVDRALVARVQAEPLVVLVQVEHQEHPVQLVLVEAVVLEADRVRAVNAVHPEAAVAVAVVERTISSRR